MSPVFKEALSEERPLSWDVNSEELAKRGVRGLGQRSEGKSLTRDPEAGKHLVRA